MTVEQQEQHILSLIYKLPILQRVRLALTVLKGVSPEDIEVNKSSSSWETPEFFAELDKRYDDMVSGKVPGIPADQVFQEIESDLNALSH